MTTSLPLVETSISDLRAALEAGRVTSVELVAGYLNRIAFYDRGGIGLNSTPVLNPKMFDEARAADERRIQGEILGPLDGIPYTAKNSYKVRGLTVAAGSPAFSRLVAQEDAFTIARLREAGAILIGLTNMPPMANGGMQRGLYGRAESPYNAQYLTAPFGSGSSNGSGTATAASFAAFGLGEETWSSGRGPASYNGLCAYTPSRGVISVRGNWPLVPTMDVVVPHTRSMADMMELLDVIVADDPVTRGDFWRTQPWVAIPPVRAVRPDSYRGLIQSGSLAGRRFGVPRMFVNADEELIGCASAGFSGGIGGPTGQPIHTRSSVLALWQRARSDLESSGAEVVEVDFPVISNYERDRPGAQTMVERGLVPDDFAEHEIWELSMLAWHDFLAANNDPSLASLADVDGTRIFPHPVGALPDRYGSFDFDLSEYVTRAKTQGITELEQIPSIADGLIGLEETRRIDFEDWLTDLSLDAVVFPAVSDVGAADMDTDPTSAEIGWRNGTWVANGNLAIRHLGIPTVTVPMGTMTDTHMPVGLTFAGRAYDDSALLRWAAAFEATGNRRQAPPRTDELEVVEGQAAVASAECQDTSLDLAATVNRLDSNRETIDISGSTPATELRVTVNGEPVGMDRAGKGFVSRVVVETNRAKHSQWCEPYGHLVMAVAAGAVGRFAVTGANDVVGVPGTTSGG